MLKKMKHKRGLCNSVSTSVLAMSKTNVGETKQIQSVESSKVEKYLASYKIKTGKQY